MKNSEFRHRVFSGLLVISFVFMGALIARADMSNILKNAGFEEDNLIKTTSLYFMGKE